ncbi:hypothetical protein K438DRAFT_1978813 [Mycena galopus ATCC 62051]|nr:hypothetical protein K438DRAFT_1978813 [Mycena galopus ATCC 62051]
MACRLPVHENSSNYVDDEDHDGNTRKFWFLVFGMGLYMKKTDADTAADSDDGVHIFNTRAQACHVWARHCRRRHSKGCHKIQEPSAHPSDTDSDHNTEAPPARARVLDRMACQLATGRGKGLRTTVEPLNREHEVKTERGVKREHQATTARTALVPVRRATSVPVKRTPPVKRTLVKREPLSPVKKLSLYADLDDKDIFKANSSEEVPLALSLAASRQFAGPIYGAKRRNVGGKRLEALAADLNKWEAEREQRVHELAEKHGMKVDEVRCRMLLLSTYRMRRKLSLYNAKISRIMAGLNSGLGVGERHMIPEVKLMVAENPLMLKGFSKKEKKEMIRQVLANRNTKTRANNLSAVADAKRTMDRLMVEIMNLAERVGMVGFAMFSWGHVHDKTLPVTIELWGAMEFFPEVLERDPANILHLFELWAVSRERGKSKKNKLLTMQQECTGIITSGLQTVLNVTKCAMTYEGYIEKIVLGKGVGLVNWPNGVDFKRMSLQSVIGPLQTLYNSLKSGTTRWKFEEMVENGEIMVKEKARKARKTRKAAIVEEGEEEEEEDGDEEDDNAEIPEPAPKSSAHKTSAKSKPSAKAKPGRKSKGAAKSAAREEGEDEEPVPARKKASSRKPAPKSSRRHEGNKDDDARAARKSVHKSTVPVEDEDDEPAPAHTNATSRKSASKLSRRHQDNEHDDAPTPRQSVPKSAAQSGKGATMQEATEPRAEGAGGER